jgi:hypothetical protein
MRSGESATQRKTELGHRFDLGILEDGLKTNDLFVMPVLLFAAPIALLIFALAAVWAVRGFKVDDSPSDE